VCQWFQQDFVSAGGLLAVLMRHLRGPQASALRQLLEDTGGGKGVVYKFAPFSFDTRPLVRHNEEDDT
jgi:hypothetical protein